METKVPQNKKCLKQVILGYAPCIAKEMHKCVAKSRDIH